MHSDHPVTEYGKAVGRDGQLVDVRGPDEVGGGTFPGAVSLSPGDIDTNTP